MVPKHPLPSLDNLKLPSHIAELQFFLVPLRQSRLSAQARIQSNVRTGKRGFQIEVIDGPDKRIINPILTYVSIPADAMLGYGL